jgi:hypothetical protein
MRRFNNYHEKIDMKLFVSFVVIKMIASMFIRNVFSPGTTSHLKKKILARNQGLSELKTAGILEVCRGFSRRINAEIGTKAFLR